MKVFDGAYRGKRVLVTGHTGFKGAWLSQWLLDQGAEVAGYSVDVPSQPALFEVLELPTHLRHTVGDIRDRKALEKAFVDFNPEVVFHLAAQALVRDSYDDPAATFDVNVTGTVNVLEAIRKSGSVRAALMITTDKCYENREWEYGYRETDRLGGKDPYSASKACAEIAVSSYFRSFLDKPGAPAIASVRAGNVIGGGDWAKDRIVPDSVRAWSRSEEVVIRSPHSTRPWQHVLEPLSGYLWLGAKLLQAVPRVNGEGFNFGPNPDANQTVGTLLEEMKKSWKEGKLRIDASTTGDKKEAGLLKLNIERALVRLGWAPTLAFSQSVGMTMEWYRRFYQGDAKTIASFTSGQIQEYERLALEKRQAWLQA